MHLALICSFLVLCSSLPVCGADILVQGIQDRQVATDRASIRIIADEGYTYAARLNGVEVPVAHSIEVTQPGYHELLVERTAPDSSVPETRLIRFIVRASARGNSEWGLPPWTPYPVVQSATPEFAGAQLRLWMPAAVPAGFPIPVIALVVNPDGRSVPVNGMVSADAFPTFQLRRGYGSAILPPMPVVGAVSYSASVGGLSATREFVLDPDPAWTPVSGVLSGTNVWPANSWVHVTSNLVLTAESSLTIGAGAMIKLGPGVEIQCSGKLLVNGNSERPVIFAPENRSTPWGGLVLRTNSAELQMTGTVLTGGGAHRDWFAANPGSGSSHRQEQPLIYLSNGARATLTDCFLVHNAGQAAHGENGFLTMTGCLVQKCISTGQFNGGSVNLRRSAFIEFPVDDSIFADDDNDALYFTQGTHWIDECLVGWAKDDGIDAGSGGAGQVTVTNSWIESCYHEALAWSGTGRIARVQDTVIVNCGQGIEAGWNSPDVLAERNLALGNLVGARFGDNYESAYQGFLRVTNSFLLYNERNIWGRTWNDWTERLDRMDLRGNFLSAPDANHPTNTVWTAEDGVKLAAFISGPPHAKVGVAFAVHTRNRSVTDLAAGIPVGLSRFSTQPVTVDYAALTPAGPIATGTIEFAPGEIIRLLRVSSPELASQDRVHLELRQPINAEITGPPLLLFAGDNVAKLISAGSEWQYLDTGVEPPADWAGVSFDDSTWRSGRAELGFGDGDEVTVIDGGPSTNRHSAAYFRRRFLLPDPSIYSGLTVRLRRDDGAIVYLNGHEVFRSNMPTGTVTYATFALSSSTSETAFFTQELDPGMLLSGTNAAAVEVHQSGRTSSDLSFDLELSGSSVPRLHAQTMPGGRLWLFWAGENFSLEEASAIIGPWRTQGEPLNPVLIMPESPRFYRLARP